MNVSVYYRSKHKLHQIDMEDISDVAEARHHAVAAVEDPDNFLPSPASPLLILLQGGKA